MVVRDLDLASVDALRAGALAFAPEDARRRLAALRTFAARPIADPETLVAYHDCLLCLLAYPQSRALRVIAGAELRRVARAARERFERRPARVRARLANTGIAWTLVTINFGWDIVRWLANRYPAHAEIDSFGDRGAPLQAILAAALPVIESELVAADEPSIEFLERASAGRRGSRLGWLVAAFERLPCSDTVREQLFDALQPFTALQPGGSTLSRTFVRGLPSRTFYHRDALVRHVDLPALLAAPLPPPRRLSAQQRAQAVDAARAMLAALGRETDAVTQAAIAEVAWHDLERGVAVALYPMRPERRNPLDSHIGMMLFKNAVPVGYGGGWPFAGTCRIGVNVFAPFRGGESAYLFAQVLRVYAQRFGVARFVAEPSQYGGTDRDGLASGAFWFYYRLGFRPVDARAARFAADEFARLLARPDARSLLGVLRRFTRGDLELRVRDDPLACDAPRLSEAVSAWIAERFGGDRTAAERAATHTVVRALGLAGHERWSDAGRSALRSLSLVLAQISGIERWPRAARQGLAAAIRAKATDELRFQRIVARHRRLRAALAGLIAR